LSRSLRATTVIVRYQRRYIKEEEEEKELIGLVSREHKTAKVVQKSRLFFRFVRLFFSPLFVGRYPFHFPPYLLFSGSPQSCENGGPTKEVKKWQMIVYDVWIHQRSGVNVNALKKDGE
jgi:hypothetical protein